MLSLVGVVDMTRSDEQSKAREAKRQAAASFAEVEALIAQVTSVIPEIEFQLERIDRMIRERQDQAGNTTQDINREEPRA